MEVWQVVRVAVVSASTPDQEGRYCIPVRMQGGKYHALLDSGSCQTLIHQSLVQPGRCWRHHGWK